MSRCAGKENAFNVGSIRAEAILSFQTQVMGFPQPQNAS